MRIRPQRVDGGDGLVAGLEWARVDVQRDERWVKTMSLERMEKRSTLDAAFNAGVEQGIAQGVEQSAADEHARIVALIMAMQAQGRTLEDFATAFSNGDLDALYREYGIEQTTHTPPSPSNPGYEGWARGDDLVADLKRAKIDIHRNERRVKAMSLMRMEKYEIESLIYNEGIDEDIDDGIREGIREGIKPGVERSVERGIALGYERGVERGFKRGFEGGFERGCATAYERMTSLIKAMGTQGCSPEDIAGELEDADLDTLCHKYNVR